jgi:probable F420-dependent oxidoreductase
MNPLRLGVNFYPFSRFPEPEDLFDLVVLCEQLGFYHVHMGEHLVVPKKSAEIMDSFWRDTSCVYSALSQLTKRIRFVYGIVIVPYRHPIQTARTLATVDQLSKGRVIMGCGVGWDALEFEALGVPYKERGARTDDYLRAIRALWSSETPAYEGRFVAFKDVIFRPGTHQKKLPMWIGGAAAAAIPRAAALGDGLAPMGGNLAWLAGLVTQTKDALAQAGREADIAGYAFTMNCDYGELVVQHALQAGAAEDDLTLSREPDRAIEQLTQWQAAGYNHVTIRFPDREPKKFADSLRRFHETVMKPMGVAA